MASEDGDKAREGSNGARGRQALVSVAAVQAVGLFMAEHASGDGSGVTLAHATIARSLGLSSSTVRRARRVLRTLGLQVETAPGGYLTGMERAEARAQHGGRQLRCAATVTLSQPITEEAADHLPRRGSYPLAASPTKMVPSGSAAGKAKTTKRPQRQHRHRWSAEAVHLADRLTDALPWLAGLSRGVLCRAISNAGIDAAAWTAGDLVSCMDKLSADEGRRFALPPKLSNPAGFFIHRIRTAMTHARMTGWERPSARAKTQAAQTRALAAAEPRPALPRETAAELHEARAAFRAQFAADDRLHELQQAARARLSEAKRAEVMAELDRARNRTARVL